MNRSRSNPFDLYDPQAIDHIARLISTIPCTTNAQHIQISSDRITQTCKLCVTHAHGEAIFARHSHQYPFTTQEDRLNKERSLSGNNCGSECLRAGYESTPECTCKLEYLENSCKTLI
ncbi:hypothetical protein WUBG_00276 [Wuchereria bancrofti]|uniref:Uncharacterized protein n=1 Tax=Wuchereria bancrofti TaxID=6293 RepID=J9F2R3_WUCBA|nr:hypothetical protein WUBG_00276 [Wuchereria bancrofti]VDM20440.1 unnamed protein product [Wuchereria bancrofti]